MRVLSSELYSVAWFKLADFVSRGEKERALNVHKLLMHSVDEQAFSYQLEGDILLSFDDEMALSKYHIAANLYKKQGEYKRAIAVYRHILLKKEELSIVESLLDVYNLLHDENNVVSTFKIFAKICLEKKETGLLLSRLHSFNLHHNKLLLARLHGILVEAMLLYDAANKQLKMYAQQATDLYKEAGNEKALLNFMDFIKKNT